jgi:hypothetical protein
VQAFEFWLQNPMVTKCSNPMVECLSYSIHLLCMAILVSNFLISLMLNVFTIGDFSSLDNTKSISPFPFSMQVESDT